MDGDRSCKSIPERAHPRSNPQHPSSTPAPSCFSPTSSSALPSPVVLPDQKQEQQQALDEVDQRVRTNYLNRARIASVMSFADEAEVGGKVVMKGREMVMAEGSSRGSRRILEGRGERRGSSLGMPHWSAILAVSSLKGPTSSALNVEIAPSTPLTSPPHNAS